MMEYLLFVKHGVELEHELKEYFIRITRAAETGKMVSYSSSTTVECQPTGLNVSHSRSTWLE